LGYATVVGVARRIVATYVANWPDGYLIARLSKDIDKPKKAGRFIVRPSEGGEWAQLEK